MSRMAFNSVIERIRELFLLEQAERQIAALTDAQRKAMRAYNAAASRRLHVASDVRGPSQTPVALELYRQGGLFFARAFLVSRQEGLDAEALTPEATIRQLDEALEADGSSAPPEFARVKPLFLSSDPLELDRLPAAQAEQTAQELEVTTRWLSRLYDTRSPREFKITRIARVAAGVAGAVALLVIFFVWVFSPKNLARGKPALSSSTMFSTTPAGAVDGSKSGQYGFHSALEDSPWLSVDLGARYAIKTAKVFGRGDSYHDQSIPLAFEASDDGTTYRIIANRQEPFSADDPWIVTPAGLVTRYIRLRTLRRSYLVLGEVEVYGQKSN